MRVSVLAALLVGCAAGDRGGEGSRAPRPIAATAEAEAEAEAEAPAAETGSAAPAATAAPATDGEARMDELVDDLLGDPDDTRTDHSKVKAAHDALVAARAAAVPALRRGLARARAGSTGRERVLTVLAHADDPAAREAVRVAAADDGETAAVAALAGRAAEDAADADDVCALARSPGLAAHVETLLVDWKSRPRLGKLIGTFVRHHAACAGELRAAAARKAAPDALKRLAAEVEARAKGKSTGWPPPAKKGAGDELTEDAEKAAKKAGLFDPVE